MRIPGMAEHPDIKAQIDFIKRAKTGARVPWRDNCWNQTIRAVCHLRRRTENKIGGHKQESGRSTNALLPLDGNALGQALLKNLGFN